MKKIYIMLALIFPILATAQAQLKALDINLNNYAYPYPVHFITVKNQEQNLRMAYMDVRPAKYNGKNIVLLHGKNFCGAYWGKTIDRLTKAGYRVIVPDQIGFGKSTKPYNFQYSFQQLAENTRTLLDSLQIKRTTVLGHSMGGMLAARFALMYPETTEKLIMEDPIGLEDWKLKVPYKNVDWWFRQELKQNYTTMRKYQEESYYHGTWKKEYDPWVNIPAGWTLNKDYSLIAWNSALTYDMIFTQPVVYEFKDITEPTLLIVGMLDRTALGKPLVSDSVRKTMGRYDLLGKETRDKIPDAKLVEIPGVGHIPHIEAFPEFIEPVLSFLQKSGYFIHKK